METLEKAVLARLDELVKEGWQPDISYFGEGWKCMLIHQLLDMKKCVFESTKEFNKGSFRTSREDISPLMVTVRGHKTMVDAIIAVCDIAELVDVDAAAR